jgi:hypothetical protein
MPLFDKEACLPAGRGEGRFSELCLFNYETFYNMRCPRINHTTDRTVFARPYPPYATRQMLITPSKTSTAGPVI